MSKKTGFSYDAIIATIDQTCTSAFSLKDQKSYLQVLSPGGHRLYVAKQAMCKRVDLSFTPDPALGLQSLVPPRAPNGKVAYELDTDHPAFAEDLALVLAWMTDAPPVPVEKKAAFVPKLPVLAQRAASSSPNGVYEDQDARRELIERVAREKGVEVSPDAGL